MYALLKEKTSQHPEVAQALLATGNQIIVEDNPCDDFWGSGRNGTGENQTGKILLRIRNELQS